MTVPPTILVPRGNATAGAGQLENRDQRWYLPS